MAAKPKAKPAAKAVPSVDNVPAMVAVDESIFAADSPVSKMAREYGLEAVEQIVSDAIDGGAVPVMHARRGMRRVPSMSGFGGQMSHPFMGMDFAPEIGVERYAHGTASVQPQMLQGGGVVNGHYAVPRGAIPATEQALSQLAARGAYPMRHYAQGVDDVPEPLLDRLNNTQIQASAAQQAAQTRGTAFGQVTPDRLANSVAASAQQAPDLRATMGANRGAYDAANPSLAQRAAGAIPDNTQLRQFINNNQAARMPAAPTLLDRMPGAQNAAAQQAAQARGGFNASAPMASGMSRSASAFPGPAAATPWYAKAGDVLGKVGMVGGAVAPFIRDRDEYSAEKGALGNVAQAASNAAEGAGGVVGGAYGAATGAALGSALPIPIAGTALGALGGGALGYFGGSEAVRRAINTGRELLGVERASDPRQASTLAPQSFAQNVAASAQRDEAAGLTGKPDLQTLDPFNSPENARARMYGTAGANGLATRGAMPGYDAEGYAIRTPEQAAALQAQHDATSLRSAANRNAMIANNTAQTLATDARNAAAMGDEREADALARTLSALGGTAGQAIGLPGDIDRNTAAREAAALGLRGAQYAADQSVAGRRLDAEVEAAKLASENDYRDRKQIVNPAWQQFTGGNDENGNPLSAPPPTVSEYAPRGQQLGATQGSSIALSNKAITAFRKLPPDQQALAIKRDPRLAQYK